MRASKPQQNDIAQKTLEFTKFLYYVEPTSGNEEIFSRRELMLTTTGTIMLKI
jgi:hypothetical protein